MRQPLVHRLLRPEEPRRSDRVARSGSGCSCRCWRTPWSGWGCAAAARCRRARGPARPASSTRPATARRLARFCRWTAASCTSPSPSRISSDSASQRLGTVEVPRVSSMPARLPNARASLPWLPLPAVQLQRLPQGRPRGLDVPSCCSAVPSSAQGEAPRSSGRPPTAPSPGSASAASRASLGLALRQQQVRQAAETGGERATPRRPRPGDDPLVPVAALGDVPAHPPHPAQGRAQAEPGREVPGSRPTRLGGTAHSRASRKLSSSASAAAERRQVPGLAQGPQAFGEGGVVLGVPSPRVRRTSPAARSSSRAKARMVSSSVTRGSPSWPSVTSARLASASSATRSSGSSDPGRPVAPRP